MSARLALSVALLLAGAALAGCVSAPAELDPASAANLGALVPEAAPLWPDHQNEPHPAFGWPTLTHPAMGASVPAWWQPIEMAAGLPETISGMELLAQAPSEVARGGGIALFGKLAIVPPGGGGQTSILDISDPSAPKLLSQFEGVGGGHRGAATIAYPDGRLVAVFSTGKGIEAWNITDPTKPEPLSEMEPKTGGHKVGVVPGTPIAYNANSNGGNANGLVGAEALDPSTAAGQTEIYDLTDPANPVLVQEFKNGYGCHHIYFWNDATQNKSRALCSGIEMTQIWDIADPRNPVVISNIPVHHGNPALPPTSVAPLVFSHYASLNTEGNILIVGDELMGGGPAECLGAQAMVKDVSGPLGAIWFYDVSDEANPKVLGFYSPPPHLISNQAITGCTAHHGRLVPDPSGERELLAMAWYGAGTVLVDFTDPANAYAVDQFNEGTNTWEAWYYNGYIFTGDLARGLDVLTLK